MTGLVLATGEAATRSVVIGLLLTALIAGFVYVICRAVGRPDWAGTGAAIVAFVGALLTLLSVV